MLTLLYSFPDAYSMQSIGAFEDPRFVAMIRMAAAAPDSSTVKLPNHVATRAGYLSMSSEYLWNLKSVFNISRLLV